MEGFCVLAELSSATREGEKLLFKIETSEGIKTGNGGLGDFQIELILDPQISQAQTPS